MIKILRRIALPFLLVALAATTWGARADQNAPALDGLFDTLVSGDTTAAKAREVTSEIWQLWLQTDNKEAQQLMNLGIRRMNEYALAEAVNVFTELIELAPEFAEAWNKRATVYYMMGEFDRSTEDVAETLRLEPRHFGALSGQGLIHLHSDRQQAAVEWFKKALKVNPFMDNVRRSVEQLESELKGKII